MLTVTHVRIRPGIFLAYGLGVATNALIALGARIVLERDLRNAKKGG